MRARPLAVVAAVLLTLLSPALVWAHTPPPAATAKPDNSDDDGGSKSDRADKPDSKPDGKADQAGDGPVVKAVEAPPAAVRSAFVSHRVFATQYAPLTKGSVEVALPDKCIKFAALRNAATLSAMKCGPEYSLDRDYRVVVTRDTGTGVILPVKEAGPWNIDDNYWDVKSPPRRMFADLPTGTPESRAAFENDYNEVEDCKDLESQPTGEAGGADQFGRCVRNPAGIDLSIAAARQLGLGEAENSWVTVTLLWEPLPVTLVNLRSGANLDLAQGSTAAGASAVQWPTNAASSQRWRLRSTGGDEFGIVSMHSGKALAVSGSPPAPGSAVVQSVPAAVATQRWRFATGEKGTLKIVSVATGQLLDVRDGSTLPGAPLIQWPLNTSESQRWRLSPAGAAKVASPA